MSVRAIDSNGDWKFGRGRNDYKRNADALAQSIDTRILSYKNDCFFDLDAGVDWFGFMGGKNMAGFRLAIATIILNTPNVTKINELNVNIDATRKVNIQYTVSTAYSTVNGIQSVSSTVNLLVNGPSF